MSGSLRPPPSKPHVLPHPHTPRQIQDFHPKILRGLIILAQKMVSLEAVAAMVSPWQSSPGYNLLETLFSSGGPSQQTNIHMCAYWQDRGCVRTCMRARMCVLATLRPFMHMTHLSASHPPKGFGCWGGPGPGVHAPRNSWGASFFELSFCSFWGSLRALGTPVDT